MAKTKIALLYERLSRDDELSGESFSIQNQENICQGGFHPKDEIPPTNSEVNDLTVTVSSMFPFLIGVANKNPFPIFISGVWFKRTIPS